VSPVNPSHIAQRPPARCHLSLGERTKAGPPEPRPRGTPVRAAKLRELASVTLMNVLYPVGQTSTMSANVRSKP
jgi:hypothetical protein